MKIILTQIGKKVTEKNISSFKEAKSLLRKKPLSWIHVEGVTKDAVKELGETFSFHPLLLDDILHTQRPKAEHFEDVLLVIAKNVESKKGEITIGQCSIVLGKQFVLTFEERKTGVFDALRERVKKGKYDTKGGDYLLYAILDELVDGYFTALEEEGEDVEHIEGELLHSPTERTLKKIHHEKREMINLRRAIWPLREVINGVSREESELIKKNALRHLRDVYEHTVEVIETIETFREMLSGMVDLYLSSISNRMNEVMKVLTIIATIFIPLTFITGVYGMNFRNMPELTNPYSYWIVLGVMFIIALGMIVYFRKKKWV